MNIREMIDVLDEYIVNDKQNTQSVLKNGSFKGDIFSHPYTQKKNAAKAIKRRGLTRNMFSIHERDGKYYIVSLETKQIVIAVKTEEHKIQTVNLDNAVTNIANAQPATDKDEIIRQLLSRVEALETQLQSNNSQTDLTELLKLIHALEDRSTNIEYDSNITKLYSLPWGRIASLFNTSRRVSITPFMIGLKDEHGDEIQISIEFWRNSHRLEMSMECTGYDVIRHSYRIPDNVNNNITEWITELKTQITDFVVAEILGLTE